MFTKKWQRGLWSSQQPHTSASLHLLPASHDWHDGGGSRLSSTQTGASARCRIRACDVLLISDIPWK